MNQSEEERKKTIEVLEESQEAVSLAIKKHSEECQVENCGLSATLLVLRCAQAALIAEAKINSPDNPLQEVLVKVAKVALRTDPSECQALITSLEMLSDFLSSLLKHSYQEVQDGTSTLQ